jgi:hypothetical protein
LKHFCKSYKRNKKIEKQKEENKIKIEKGRRERFGPEEETAHGPVPLNRTGTLRWPHPR